MGILIVAVFILNHFNQRAYEQHSELNTLSQIFEQRSLMSNILQARRNEKDFLLRNNLKYISTHEQTMQVLYNQLSTLNTQLLSQGSKDLLQNLKQKLEQYQAA